MPSLFGKGKSAGNSVYHRIDQHDSDSEFSLSEDEKVLFKRQGEIELHLCPETQIQRPKKTGLKYKRYLGISLAILLIVASLTVVLVVYKRSHNEPSSEILNAEAGQQTGSKVVVPGTTKKPHPGMHQDISGEGWGKTFKDVGGEGSIRLLDMDGDGLDDVLISSASMNTPQFEGSNTFTNFTGLHTWCETQDDSHAYPCLSTLIALRGLDGSELWRLPIRSDAFVINCKQFDINQDGKMDCIATGRMSVVVAFDPYKGEVLWTCEDDKFLMPYWNTYNAAALPDWNDDGVPEVLIANGGDVMKDPSDHDRAPGRLIVLSGATGKPIGDRYLDMPHSKETYMSPVIYRPNNDTATYILFGSGGETVPGDLMGISVMDFCHFILGDDAMICSLEKDKYFMAHFNKNDDGIFVIYEGKEKGVMVPPVIVDVDIDGTLDVLMTSFEGVMILYNGHDLIEVWTAPFQNSETYGTPAPGYFDDDGIIDFMINWNQGIWMDYSSSTVAVVSGKNGSVLWSLQSNYMQMSSCLSISTNLKNQDTFMFKVQGRDSDFHWKDGHLIRPNKTSDRNKRHKEPPNADENMSPEKLQKKLSEGHLNCDDDLSTFRGEIFVLDRTMLKNPIRIMNVPTIKHHYYPSQITPASDKQTLGGHQVSPIGPHDREESPPDSENVNPDSPRRKREATKNTQMCSVESPDYMGIGAIGDLDGDNNLDFVFINEISVFVLDANMSPTSALAEFNVQKVNMEIGIQDGVLKHVSVNATTSMTSSRPPGVPGAKVKTYLPMDEQKWTQYMGSKGTNTYV